MKIAVIAFLLLATTAFGSYVEYCHLKFFKDYSDLNTFFYETTWSTEKEPVFWTVPNLPNDGSKVPFSSIRAVSSEEQPFCSENCKLTIFSRPSYAGRSEVYYPGTVDVTLFPFCAKSYILDCPYIPNEEEAEEDEEEEEETEEEEQEEQ